MTMVGRSKGSSLTCSRLCIVLRVKPDPDKCTDPVLLPRCVSVFFLMQSKEKQEFLFSFYVKLGHREGSYSHEV